jgi:peptidoglycan L-alanyl-D-glutamate endopeptidase CwlK
VKASLAYAMLPKVGTGAYEARLERQQSSLSDASRALYSRHLTGHAVDLVALDGEISWQWEDHFRVAAAMQASSLVVPLSRSASTGRLRRRRRAR